MKAIRQAPHDRQPPRVEAPSNHQFRYRQSGEHWAQDPCEDQNMSNTATRNGDSLKVITNNSLAARSLMEALGPACPSEPAGPGGPPPTLSVTPV